MVNCQLSLQCSVVLDSVVVYHQLYSMFLMNVFIQQLRCLGVGCCISSLFLGCILYADDILLLSPAVVGLQSMLDKCTNVLAELLSFEFNVKVTLYSHW